MRSIVQALRRRLALRDLVEWARPVSRADDAGRFGAAASVLARLARANVAVEMGVVLDGESLNRLRAIDRDARAEIVRRLVASVGATRLRLVSTEASQSIASADLTEALAAINGPVLLQTDHRVTVHIVGRAPEALGQLALTIDGRRRLIGRLSGRCLDETHPDPDAVAHVALTCRIEEILGSACEITLIGTAERLRVQACRPLAWKPGLACEVDRIVTLARRQSDRHADLQPGKPLLRPTHWSERLPMPTAATLDLLTAMHGPGVDLHATVHGRLLGFAPQATRNVLPYHGRRARADAASFARTLRQTRLPQYRTASTMMAAVDLSIFTTAEVLHLWRRQRASFLDGVQADAQRITTFSEQAGGTDAPRIRPQWEQDVLLTRHLSATRREHALRRIAGHRATLDYELAEPRYADIPGALSALVDTVAAKSTDPRHAQPPGSAAVLVALAEDARHEAVRHLDVLRRLLLDLDRRFALGGVIFDLCHDEIANLNPETANPLRALAAARRAHRRALAELPALPCVLTVDDIERLPGIARPCAASTGTARGRGVRVSGGVATSGRACIVSGADAELGTPLVGFRDGDILVTPRVHPAWIEQLARASGVISACGDADGPIACAARDIGIAMIVDLPNEGQFCSGDRLTLHVDGRVTVGPDVVSRLKSVPPDARSVSEGVRELI